MASVKQNDFLSRPGTNPKEWLTSERVIFVSSQKLKPADSVHWSRKHQNMFYVNAQHSAGVGYKYWEIALVTLDHYQMLRLTFLAYTSVHRALSFVCLLHQSTRDGFRDPQFPLEFFPVLAGELSKLEKESFLKTKVRKLLFVLPNDLQPHQVLIALKSVVSKSDRFRSSASNGLDSTATTLSFPFRCSILKRNA
ncbi:hypothetical protein ACLKA6_014926 [Drosophila palustris]